MSHFLTLEVNHRVKNIYYIKQGITFDSSNNFYLADTKVLRVVDNKAVKISGVYFKSPEGKEIELITKEFDNEEFRELSSLAYNKEDNCIYVCDSGPFGTTSLNKPSGSLYLIEIDSLVMRPLLHNCLSHPSDVIYDSNLGMVYVADTYSNKIIRLSQNPAGTYHASVFHQFNGLIGPTSLAVDDAGNLYVGRFEYQVIAIL